MLAQFVLGWDSARFVTAIGEPWPSAPLDLPERFEQLVQRRERREPLAYIVGEREFWGLSFAVSRAVLIPRPETELILETALNLYTDRDQRILAADVGTGSGCLAVALAHEFPRAQILATDSSRPALMVAKTNAVSLGTTDRVLLAQMDLLTGARGLFDLIVANPPYIPAPDRNALQPEVREYEPAEALFAGDAGLDIIVRLIAASSERLRPGGGLLFEFGVDQAVAVTGLISSVRGLTMVDLRRDLQGIPRVAIAHKR